MPDLIMIGDIPVEHRRNKQRRTRIAVNIDPAGHVVLDTPLHTQDLDVETLINEHARWLRYRVNEIQSELAERGTMHYQAGEVVLYLGEPLQLMTWEKPHVVLGPGVLSVPRGDETALREAVRGWYQFKARTVFAEVIDSFAELPWLAGKVPPWKQRFMKSQWGSCSTKGLITLNTHLVRMERSLIEYVVLHELCHLKHHAHSRRFHALIGMYMPDWPDRSQALRRYIGLLLDT